MKNLNCAVFVLSMLWALAADAQTETILLESSFGPSKVCRGLSENRHCAIVDIFPTPLDVQLTGDENGGLSGIRNFSENLQQYAGNLKVNEFEMRATLKVTKLGNSYFLDVMMTDSQTNGQTGELHVGPVAIKDLNGSSLIGHAMVNSQQGQVEVDYAFYVGPCGRLSSCGEGVRDTGRELR